MFNEISGDFMDKTIVIGAVSEKIAEAKRRKNKYIKVSIEALEIILEYIKE